MPSPILDLLHERARLIDPVGLRLDDRDAFRKGVFRETGGLRDPQGLAERYARGPALPCSRLRPGDCEQGFDTLISVIDRLRSLERLRGVIRVSLRFCQHAQRQRAGWRRERLRDRESPWADLGLSDGAQLRM